LRAFVGWGCHRPTIFVTTLSCLSDRLRF
jgi:hypothetical protein